ncbi:unnamed protein product [Lampetra planeri]
MLTRRRAFTQLFLDDDEEGELIPQAASGAEAPVMESIEFCTLVRQQYLEPASQLPPRKEHRGRKKLFIDLVSAIAALAAALLEEDKESSTPRPRETGVARDVWEPTNSPDTRAAFAVAPRPWDDCGTLWPRGSMAVSCAWEAVVLWDMREPADSPDVCAAFTITLQAEDDYGMPMPHAHGLWWELFRACGKPQERAVHRSSPKFFYREKVLPPTSSSHRRRCLPPAD